MDEHAKYETLLGLSRSVASRRDLQQLFADLRAILNRVLPVDYVLLTTYNEAADTVTLRLIDSAREHFVPIGNTYPAIDSPSFPVIHSRQPIYYPVRSQVQHPRLRETLERNGIESQCMFPLETAHGIVGVLGAGVEKPHAYSDSDREFLMLASKQIAVAVDNVLAQEKLARERDRLRLVLDLNQAIATELELKPLLNSIARIIRPHLEQEYFGITLWDADGGNLLLGLVDFPESAGFLTEEARIQIPLDDTPAGLAFQSGEMQILGPERMKEMCASAVRTLENEGIQTLCVIPLISARGKVGTMNIGSRKPNAFAGEILALLSEAAGQIAIAVDNALAYQKIAELNQRLEREKLYLVEEIRGEYSFEEIIGHSPEIRRVLQQVEVVAPSDSTVLILGESGTGKELIARAIHNRSPRSRGTFVKLNCAAIPAGLLESEIFGHERGAFTGALATKIGRFELADRGTLFLDEIGELPLELQPKLLRVLQEKEFERLGSPRTLKSDARVVAATNRNLERMVADKLFRLDLFYRLNIFPIEVPSLRQRRSDIVPLVRHFVGEYSRRLGKQILTIPSHTLEALERYDWPGNIRELQNVIERSVLLTREQTLRVDLSDLHGLAPIPESKRPSELADTMDNIERRAIEAAIERAQGRIGGPGGAAEQLGLKRTTLISRMKKLGLSRSFRISRG